MARKVWPLSRLAMTVGGLVEAALVDVLLVDAHGVVEHPVACAQHHLRRHQAGQADAGREVVPVGGPEPARLPADAGEQQPAHGAEPTPEPPESAFARSWPAPASKSGWRAEIEAADGAVDSAP